MTVWLTSDLHLGHVTGAMKHRSFRSVAEHDARIITNLMRYVQPEDTLWVLGDVALGGWEQTIRQLREVPGTKRCILGNHDRPHPMMSSGHTHLTKFAELAGFESVHTSATLRYEGKTYLLSHFPYEGDTNGRTPDRETQWRLRDEGVPIIHGHTHSASRFSVTTRGTPQYHVGVDAWGFKPVTLADVVSVSG